MEAKTSGTREAPASREVLRHQEHGKDRSSSASGTTTSCCPPSPPPPPTSPAGGRRGRSACSSRKLRGLKPHVQGYLRRKSLKKICHPRYSQFKAAASLTSPIHQRTGKFWIPAYAGSYVATELGSEASHWLQAISYSVQSAHISHSPVVSKHHRTILEKTEHSTNCVQSGIYCF